MEKPFTFADIFCGIGGFHIALSGLGGECVFAAEIDDAARRTYEANFRKESPALFDGGNFIRDITTVDVSNIPDFDVLCAGFPCQPFSQAGFKKGFKEARGTLFFDIARIIKAKKGRKDRDMLNSLTSSKLIDNSHTSGLIVSINYKQYGAKNGSIFHLSKV